MDDLHTKMHRIHFNVTELTLAEMRVSFEKERLRVVSEARRASQAELEAAVRAAKAKQW